MMWKPQRTTPRLPGESVKDFYNRWRKNQNTFIKQFNSFFINRIFKISVPMEPTYRVALAKAKREVIAHMRAKTWAEKIVKIPECRICGCTNQRACEGGCHWIEPDLCSACAGKE